MGYSKYSELKTFPLGLKETVSSEKSILQPRAHNSILPMSVDIDLRANFDLDVFLLPLTVRQSEFTLLFLKTYIVFLKLVFSYINLRPAGGCLSAHSLWVFENGKTAARRDFHLPYPPIFSATFVKVAILESCKVSHQERVK